ncbi:MAG: DUF1320 family protein [Planctomycetaceae bacterium]|nr:DUF1320 family protein [Planctomycetaceae bacterium]
MASYATPAQIIERYDVRDIGQLVADDDTQVAAGDLDDNTVLLAALADASGDIEAALLAGERYTVANLEGLTGNSASKLVRLTCDIAMAYLYGRRPAHDPDKLKAFEERAAKQLERLRKGENVFNLAPQKEAGRIDHATPSAADISKMQLLRDRCPGYYPKRTFPTN